MTFEQQKPKCGACSDFKIQTTHRGRVPCPVCCGPGEFAMDTTPPPSANGHKFASLPLGGRCPSNCLNCGQSSEEYFAAPWPCPKELDAYLIKGNIRLKCKKPEEECCSLPGPCTDGGSYGILGWLHPDGPPAKPESNASRPRYSVKDRYASATGPEDEMAIILPAAMRISDNEWCHAEYRLRWSKFACCWVIRRGREKWLNTNLMWACNEAGLKWTT